MKLRHLPDHRLGRWIRRRLTPRGERGLRLTLAVLLWFGTLGLFTLLAVEVATRGRLTHFDERLGLKLRDVRQAEPSLRAFFVLFTDVGDVPVMTGLAILVALVLFWRRQRGLALLWIGALAGTGLLDAGLKLLFDRERPEFRDISIETQTRSFPSGHSMGSMVGYGLLAYLLFLALPRRWAWWVVAGLGFLILAIGFSRLLLGAHYFSAVLGGFSLGACWLICFASVEPGKSFRSG